MSKMRAQGGRADVKSATLLLHRNDDVLVAKVGLPAGTLVQTASGPVALPAPVPAGHKIAYRGRAEGEPIHRYGQVIGLASTSIRPGDHVHVHNLGGGEMRQVSQVRSRPRSPAARAPEETPSFAGYVRPDGRVGTRNYVAVISTVNCSASVSRFVKERFGDVARDYPGVDGVVALTHRGGCGLLHDGEDRRLLQRVLANYATHPNVAAYVLVGLGCEVNQPQELVGHHRLAGVSISARPPPIVQIQQAGGVRKAVEAVAAEVTKLLPVAAAARRTPQPLSALTVATNCGGSDSYSGITANPAVGWAVDEIVRHGGAAILGETTEIVGAEQLLLRRAANEAVARKLLERIAWWRRHLQAHGGDVDENPSPGNLAGGITTVLEKALGGVSKGGTTPLVDVVEYAERVTAKGLVFMDTPAYDPVSVTGMVAGGANLVAFTTGRGSVFGATAVPTIKLASNSEMYASMEEDMDIDCGAILTGSSIEATGQRILGEMLEVASGKRTKSEAAGIGDEEFAPWIQGPTL